MKYLLSLLLSLLILALILFIHSQIYYHIPFVSEDLRSEEEKEKAESNLGKARKFYIYSWITLCILATLTALMLSVVQESRKPIDEFGPILFGLLYYEAFAGLISKSGGLKYISPDSKVYNILNPFLIIALNYVLFDYLLG